MRPLEYIMCGLLAVSAASCTGSVDSLVRDAAAHCPVTIEGVGFVREIRLSGDTLVYDCSVTNREVNIEALRGSAASVKRVMSPGILRLFDNNQELLEAVRANGLILSVRYSGVDGGAPLVVDFQDADLAPEEERKSCTGADPQKRLADEIAVSRATLPARLADGIDVVNVDTVAGMVVFFCRVFEDIAGIDAIDNLKSNAGSIRSEMLDVLKSGTDSDVAALVEIATDAGFGIAYRYEGSGTGKAVEIDFPVETLKK